VQDPTSLTNGKADGRKNCSGTHVINHFFFIRRLLLLIRRKRTERDSEKCPLTLPEATYRVHTDVLRNGLLFRNPSGVLYPLSFPE
jgi:hypothetical protein